MRPALERALAILAGVAAAPLLLLASFDASWFYPRLQHARMQVQEPSLGSDPRLATFLEADRLSPPAVTRLVLSQPEFGGSGRSPGNWVLKYMFSDLLLRLHCNSAEQRTLFATLVYVGPHGHGLQAAAHGLYGRDLHSLDDRQLATVVALPRFPRSYEEHPDRLAARAKWLLARVPDAR